MNLKTVLVEILRVAEKATAEKATNTNYIFSNIEYNEVEIEDSFLEDLTTDDILFFKKDFEEAISNSELTREYICRLDENEKKENVGEDFYDVFEFAFGSSQLIAIGDIVYKTKKSTITVTVEEWEYESTSITEVKLKKE